VITICLGFADPQFADRAAVDKQVVHGAGPS
jgi:hypothetical protein